MTQDSREKKKVRDCMRAETLRGNDVSCCADTSREHSQRSKEEVEERRVIVCCGEAMRTHCFFSSPYRLHGRRPIVVSVSVSVGVCMYVCVPVDTVWYHIVPPA
uniref:Bm10771 n=1 Tax=Brugia malayi TaxID=6279 RepID=A0A0J9Y125_BRUMA|nr:Bm10771 [Brugia malayi]